MFDTRSLRLPLLVDIKDVVAGHGHQTGNTVRPQG